MSGRTAGLCSWIFGLALIAPAGAGAADLLYPRPQPISLPAADQEKSCVRLDREIAALLPLTYSYQPGFYDDPRTGAAIWVGTLYFPPAYALAAYSQVESYREGARIRDVRQRIEVLRGIKARKRCFEPY